MTTKKFEVIKLVDHDMLKINRQHRISTSTPTYSVVKYLNTYKYYKYLNSI